MKLGDKNKGLKKIKNYLCHSIECLNICEIGVPEERRKGGKKCLKK